MARAPTRSALRFEDPLYGRNATAVGALRAWGGSGAALHGQSGGKPERKESEFGPAPAIRPKPIITRIVPLKMPVT